MDKNMKLSDVEAQKPKPFGQPGTFAQAFPTVQSVRIELRPNGEGFEPFMAEQERVDVYTETTFPRIIDCRNPRCYGGGLDLGYLLRWTVVEAKRTEYEATIRCKGYEGSPKGRKNDGPCDTYFKVKITVTYKPDASVL